MAGKTNNTDDPLERLRNAVVADAARPGFWDRVVWTYLPELAELVRSEERHGYALSSDLARALLSVYWNAAHARHGNTEAAGALSAIGNFLPEGWRHRSLPLADEIGTARAVRDGMEIFLTLLEKRDIRIDGLCRDLVAMDPEFFPVETWGSFTVDSWRRLRPEERASLLAALFDIELVVVSDEYPSSGGMAEGLFTRGRYYAHRVRTFARVLLAEWNQPKWDDRDWWSQPARVRATKVTEACLRSIRVPHPSKLFDDETRKLRSRKADRKHKRRRSSDAAAIRP